MKRRSVVQASWYDSPHYYDLAFRSETRPEAGFLEAAFAKYCAFTVRRVLEPACGTGRLVTEMAARGYRASGFDLSEASLAYLRRRLQRRGLKAEVVCADMADFRLRVCSKRGLAPSPTKYFPRKTATWRGACPLLEQTLSGPFDAAYCTFDSFRHLLTERSAQSHLQGIADSLRPGGIYILGFHLLPPDASEECTERWTERQGRTQVTVTLRVLATDRRRRVETIRISVLARTGSKESRLRDEFPLRMYTAGQFRRLLAKVPDLELVDVYDFWYEIDQPLTLSDELSDTVFVLRRR